MPNSKFCTHCMLFFSREATSEIYGPHVSSLSYLPSRYIFIRFYFQIYIFINPKIPCWNLFAFICIYQSITTFSHPRANFWRRYLKGIDYPFNTSGCKYLFFVCRYRLHSVAWLSYWIDTLVSELREIPTIAILHHPFLFGEIPTQFQATSWINLFDESNKNKKICSWWDPVALFINWPVNVDWVKQAP